MPDIATDHECSGFPSCRWPGHQPPGTAACSCPPGLRSVIGDVASWDIGLLKVSKSAEWGEGAFRVSRECGWQTWRVLRLFDTDTTCPKVEARREA